MNGLQRARILRCRARIEEERKNEHRRLITAELRLLSVVSMVISLGMLLTNGFAAAAVPAGVSTVYELSQCQETHRLELAGSAINSMNKNSLNTRRVSIRSPVSSRGCTARFAWPVRAPEIVRSFDKPEHNWNPGHRGVDLRAVPGDELLAPADGVISFVGRVAGKSVVSIRHGALTSMFEPAVSNKDIGARLNRGEAFASVQGESDHCKEHCVHWGIKRGKTDYTDPNHQVIPRKIGLLP